MIGWRLTSTLYPPLTGEGARKRGGRWNSPGVPLVYGSAHLSLAVLEVLVHVESDDLPESLMAYQLDVPDELIEYCRDVPQEWLDDPLRRQSRRYGDAWAAERRSAVLVVPSAVVPFESNLLFNPLHPRFAEIRIVGEHPFRFDHRLQ